MELETIFSYFLYLVALLLSGAVIVLCFGDVPTKEPLVLQEGLKIKKLKIKGLPKKLAKPKTLPPNGTNSASNPPPPLPPSDGPSPDPSQPEPQQQPPETTPTDTISPEEANAPIVLSDKLKGNYDSNIEAAQAVKRQLMGLEKITLKIVGNEIKNMVADMDDKEKEIDKYLT